MTVKEMTALEGFLMVISIAVLFLLRKYLDLSEDKES